MSWWTLLWQQLPRYLASSWRRLLLDLYSCYCHLCGVHIFLALQTGSSTGVLVFEVQTDELSISSLSGQSARVCSA